jgi:hypothetical protein
MALGKLALKIPVARLLIVGELLLLANEHFQRLDAQERRRVIELIRRGRGRPGNLSERDRRELTRLMEKAEPREFAKNAAKRMVGMRGRRGQGV